METFSLKKHNNFLKGVSDFFALGTDAEHRSFCPKHHIEHIGKTAYSIGIDMHLYKTFGEDKYYERAYHRALRVASKLTKVKETYVFLPDGDERWNMSQRVIDTGAATDMLATFLRTFKDRLSEADALLLKDVIYKSSDTYLVDAAVQKAPTNQRLWGASGLASAYTLYKEEKWRVALEQSVVRSLAEMREDGSFPYITAYDGYADITHNDVTPFYHSRHAAYIWHVFDMIGGEHTEEIAKLVQSADFLIALYQADGKKNIELETKQWYFLSDYEISSNSYDAYLFLRAYEHTKNEKYAYFAAIALRWLYEHQAEDGGLVDHWGKGVNFQCRHFWNSNTAWIARITPLIAKYDGKSMSAAGHFLHCEPSGIANLSTDSVALIVRGSKVERRVTMGPKIGGGSLLYVGKKSNRYENLLKGQCFTLTESPGNFHLLNVGREVRISIRDCKVLLYYALLELRGFSFKGFLERISLLVREIIYPKQHASSAFMCRVPLQVNGNSITAQGGLATRSGKEISGYSLERRYSYAVDEVAVQESLEQPPQKIGRVYYVLPAVAREVHIEGKHRRWKNKIYLESSHSPIVIEYKI